MLPCRIWSCIYPRAFRARALAGTRPVHVVPRLEQVYTMPVKRQLPNVIFLRHQLLTYFYVPVCSAGRHILFPLSADVQFIPLVCPTLDILFNNFDKSICIFIRLVEILAPVSETEQNLLTTTYFHINVVNHTYVMPGIAIPRRSLTRPHRLSSRL